MESHELTSAVMNIENTLQEILSVLREIQPEKRYGYKMNEQGLVAVHEIAEGKTTKVDSVPIFFESIQEDKTKKQPKEINKETN